MQPIIKNMPIPAMKRKGAAPIYPWADMKPGNAFMFNSGVSMSGASSLAYQRGKQHKMKFAVRQVGEEVWCWRIDGTPHSAVNGNYRPVAEIIENYGATAPVADDTMIVGQEDPI